MYVANHAAEHPDQPALVMASSGEVVRFKPDATLDRRIKIPATMVTSLVFGGRDLGDLYIVTADNTEDSSRKGTIFRMRSEIPGLPVPKADF